VDDSQLSLAIGKKGQNVRLAAKLLGWKIDIKSEEEKRQEVESQMAALVAPGAPVSVLIDYGLGDKVVERLIETGIGTIEKLGGMTPEQLEEIPDIGLEAVERIQMAVNAYYGQFEEPAAPAAEPAAEAVAEVVAEAAEQIASAPEAGEAVAEPEAGEAEASETEAGGEQSGTIEGAGFPTHNSDEGAGPEVTGPVPGTAEERDE